MLFKYLQAIILSLIIIFCFKIFAFSHVQKIEGLDYSVDRLLNPPVNKLILKNFEIYQIFLENMTDMIFTVPGYSVDLGVEYNDLSDVLALLKDKNSKKLSVLNFAAGAASIAFGGGIAKSAANTAVRSVGVFKRKGFDLSDEKFVLSPMRTYVIYPNDSLGIYFFLDKRVGQLPKIIRFICKDEESNITSAIVNQNLEVHEIDLNIYDANLYFMPAMQNQKNVIAVPESEQYN